MSTTPVTAGYEKQLYDYGIRVAAHEQSQIMARTSTRHQHIGDAARILGLVTSPGDHAGLWGVIDGAVDAAKPNIITTGDPSTFAGQAHLWELLGQKWSQWLRTALAAGQLPQLIVADRTAIARLTWSARRVVRHPDTSEAAAAAARYVIVAESLLKAPGSQVFLPITDILREHFITGADPSEETHLGHWLSYPEHTADWAREQTGLDEDFEAEDTRFGKTVDRMYASHGEMRQNRANRVVPMLAPVLTRRFQDIRAGLDLYGRHPGPVMPAAEAGYAQDTKTIARYVTNGTTPGFKSIASRVATLRERENRAAYWATAMWAQDRMEALRAAATGDVLSGMVEHGALVVHGPVRARPGDTFTTAAGEATVGELSTRGGATTVTFDVLLTEEDTLLTPTVQDQRHARWVTPGWVHTYDAPASGPTAALDRGNLTAWAESLKAPAGPDAV